MCTISREKVVQNTFVQKKMLVKCCVKLIPSLSSKDIVLEIFKDSFRTEKEGLRKNYVKFDTCFCFFDIGDVL